MYTLYIGRMLRYFLIEIETESLETWQCDPVWGEMAFSLSITTANVKKCQDQRSEVTAAKTVVSTWQQSAALSRRYCSVDSVRLILKKENGQKAAPVS